MRLYVDLSEAEAATVRALVQVRGEWFAMGYLVFEKSSVLKWRPSVSGALLTALQNLASFRTEGSGAQTLYGKVLRLSAGVLN